MELQQLTVSDYVAAIKQCTSTKNLAKGKRLHRETTSVNLHVNKFVAAALIKMYSSCSSIEIAHLVFNETPFRDAVTWNSLILGYVAMDIFTNMGCRPTTVTFVAGLKACEGLVTERKLRREFVLEKVIALHKQVKVNGFLSDVVLSTTLIDVYSKCGYMRHAKIVFESMINRNVVGWNALIQGYVENGLWFVAMDLFACMDCHPDAFTYSAVLEGYGDLASEGETEKGFSLEKGVDLHKEMLARKLGPDLVMTNTLIHLYSRCGLLEAARKVFDGTSRRSVVSWTSLIAGYVDHEEYLTGMELFHRMDCQPDALTFVAAMKACGGVSSGG